MSLDEVFPLCLLHVMGHPAPLLTFYACAREADLTEINVSGWWNLCVSLYSLMELQQGKG